MTEDNELCADCGMIPASDSFMVQCDSCNKWYHGKCCFLTEWQAAEYEIYHCKRCEPLKGLSKRKKRQNWHRHDCFEKSAENKPPQCGTIAFLKLLKGKKFADSTNVIKHVPDGTSLTREFFELNGFSRPIVVNDNNGLYMKVPDAASFTVSKAAEALGNHCRIDIIDSERQLVFESTLGRLREYFAANKRDKIYNVISLELTGTQLESTVQPPAAVREMSWLPSIWPDEAINRLTNAECPRTERFLLMSAAGSFTDFHIDFGGSSVWYHIVKGAKVFYLSPPSETNLKAYEKWNDSKNRVEQFLGDELKPCYKLSLVAGQTLLLPGGWIHAVVTPSDSLVFGGNFLHSLDVPLQLRIFDLEQRIRTDSKFLFPEFHSVNFFAARKISELLRDDSMSLQYRKILLSGASALHSSLRRWMAEEKAMRNCVLTPTERIEISSNLNKAIHYAEELKFKQQSSLVKSNHTFDDGSPVKKPKIIEGSEI